MPPNQRLRSSQTPNSTDKQGARSVFFIVYVALGG